MNSNVLLHATSYSKVNKPEESGVYDFNLEFFPEGIKENGMFGASIKSFLSMKSLYNGVEQDVISSMTLFQFLTDELTEEDLVWMFNAAYEELKSYPLAEEENITDILNTFPEVTNETANLNNDLIKWFYENR